MNYKECEFYSDNGNCGCYDIITDGTVESTVEDKCIKNPNCYFKQNLALKEENEKLTQIVNKALDDKDRLLDKNTALKKELQAYKEDRFCQGGCVVYQYDKIKALKEKLKVAVEALKRIKELKATCIQSYNPLSLLDSSVVKPIAQQALTQIGEIE